MLLNHALIEIRQFGIFEESFGEVQRTCRERTLFLALSFCSISALLSRYISLILPMATLIR